jgi:NAD(P)-dependent dehydrogenase (short-subunit alcohol dehydrogenase family)
MLGHRAPLEGKVIVVIGGTTGLGLSAAQAFVRAGARVVVTGRNAKAELIEAADCVTEMTAVKHHFAAGVKAQAGIEF